MRTVAVILVLLLAGCAASPAPAEPEPKPFKEVEVVKGAGAISGIVVNEAIMPVADANISLHDGPATTTDESGRFTFEGVEPGVYFLSVTANGHESVQSSVEVVEGDVVSPRILIRTIPVIEPSHYTLQLNGYIQLSAGIVGIEANIVLGILGQEDPLCDCNLVFSTEGQNVTAFIVEAFWTPSMSDPVPALCQDCLYFSFADVDYNAANTGYKPAPIYEAMPRDRFPAESVEWEASLTGDFDWINVEQEYQLFVTVFSVAAPPEGWTVNQG